MAHMPVIFRQGFDLFDEFDIAGDKQDRNSGVDLSNPSVHLHSVQ